MNLQNISQKIKLKLEHNLYGTLLMALANPFYSRPHHFWNAQNSIAGRVGKLLVFVPAFLFYKLWVAMFKAAMDYYETKQAFTAPMKVAFETESNTMTWYMVLGIVACICAAAGIAFGFNKLACGLWGKLGRNVKSAPFDFYLARSASWATWLCILMFAALYVYKFGAKHAMALVQQFMNDYGIVVLFLLVGCLVINKIIQNNSFSSAMEIYGSRTIVVINTVVAIVLIVGAVYLLPILSKLALFT